jgi:hypothetical protein
MLSWLTHRRPRIERIESEAEALIHELRDRSAMDAERRK